jgi:hypothetical protein
MAMAPTTAAARLRWSPGMPDEEIEAGLAVLDADPEIQAFLATAPKDLAPDEAARIARLLWPRKPTRIPDMKKAPAPSR